MIEYDKFQMSLGRLEEQHTNYQNLDASLPDLIQEAIAESVIQRFETCYDCLWKVLKRYLIEELGLVEVSNSPKPVFKLAHENDLFASPLDPWCSTLRAVSAPHTITMARRRKPVSNSCQTSSTTLSASTRP